MLNEKSVNNEANLDAANIKISSLEERVVKNKGELLQTLTQQWKECVDVNLKNENAIKELKNSSDDSVNIARQNNSCIDMIQNILKDLQESTDRNKANISSLIKTKVDNDK